MDIFVDASPDYLYSSSNEPCEVNNQLVLQIRNITDDDIELKNDDKILNPAFEPIDKAEPINGLSMIYLKFCLGNDDNCLTSIEEFNAASLHCQNGFKVNSLGDGTLVFYPLETVVIPFNGCVELVIDGLVTHKKNEVCSFCRVKSFNINGDGLGKDGRTLINVKRHPIAISQFTVASGYEIAGFRDDVRFEWLALGADNCRLTPGDTELSAASSEPSGAHTVRILSATSFVLVASRDIDTEAVTKVLEITPLEASIESFSCSVEDSAAVLKFKVMNTRHAFIDRVGRIEITPNEENILRLPHTFSNIPYTLTVENENGLLSKSCTP